MQPIDVKRKVDADKAQRSLLSSLRTVPRFHLISATALALCLIGFSALPERSTSEPTKRQVQTIEIPALAATPIEQPLPPERIEVVDHSQQQSTAKTEKVRPGDNLSLIFKRAGLTDRTMIELLNSNNGKKLASLYPGHTLTFELSSDNTLNKLTYVVDRLHSFSYTREESGFSYQEHAREPDTMLSTRAATIEESLFLAGKEAQLDDRLVMELAGIFGWDIDFMLDIRKGDSFRVLFEEKYLDGQKIGNGNILAAEFVNRSKTFRAVRYEDSQGNAQYYTPTGETMRKEFLRTPIDFARISSHFNLNRKHPVLNRIRAHKGTDYAAARGTPIKAAGDGKVIFAGRKGGYGNVVIIQHGQTYKTLYAHISKFRKGIRRGTRVKQGQVIAYVGSTGLASGPHLHYEFHVNGAVRNPVTVKLPKAQSVPKEERQRFYNQTQPLLAELNPQGRQTKVATTDTHTGTKNL